MGDLLPLRMYSSDSGLIGYGYQIVFTSFEPKLSRNRRNRSLYNHYNTFCCLNQSHYNLSWSLLITTYNILYVEQYIILSDSRSRTSSGCLPYHHGTVHGRAVGQRNACVEEKIPVCSSPSFFVWNRS